ncbi:MAG: ferric reductase-like transmembrane domain-containing protein [Thermoplasmatota archaeon]
MRTKLLLLLLLAIAFAVAQSPQNEGASNVKDSECYDCHQQGGSGGGRTALVEMFVVNVEEAAITPGEAFDFNVTVRNTWWAKEYDIHAELDVGRVPALAFAANEPPTSGAGAADIPGATVSDREAKSAETKFTVPVGATDFVFQATQDQPGDESATLTAELWAPGESTSQAGTAISLPYHWTLRGSRTIADASGEYTLRITRAGLLDDLNELDQVQEEQSITTKWGAWYNVTDQPTQFLASADVLDGQEKSGLNHTTFSWRLYAEELPKEGQSVDVNVQLTGHYRHAASQSSFDTWRFEKSLKFPFTFPEPVEGEEPPDVFVIGNNETEAEPEVIVSENIPLARFGEILGYTAAFLVVSSLTTGSIFGRPMKWFTQLFFRKARARIAYHNFTSQALLWVALAHLGLFLYEQQYHWSIGLFFGGISILLLFILALTGIFQVPIIRGMGYGGWKFIHYSSALLLIFSISAHILMDGIHFEFVQEEVAKYYEWNDPLREAFGPSPAPGGSSSSPLDS